MGAVNTRLDGIRAEFQRVAAGGGGAEEEDNLNNFDVDEEEREGTQRQPSCTFAYSKYLYAVPQDFCFLKATLQEGLQFWLQGQTV